MALHIRDFRPGDTTALSRLQATGRRLGPGPADPTSQGSHILVGLQDNVPVAAIWLSLTGGCGQVPALLVPESDRWTITARELLAEAILWLGARHARTIDLQSADHALQALLRSMKFEAARPSLYRRVLIPVPNAS